MTTITDLTSSPPTHTYTTRCDCRHLATLATYWNSKGERPRSSSELIRLCIESLSSALISGGEVEFIEDLDVAIETLHRFGLKGQAQGRNIQDLRLNLASISRGPQPDGLARIHTQASSGKITQIEKNIALAEFESRLLNTREEVDAAQLTEFKDSFKTPPKE